MNCHLGYLKIFWGRWKHTAIEVKLMKHKHERAATYQRRTLGCKYMEYWKLYIHITRRKNVRKFGTFAALVSSIPTQNNIFAQQINGLVSK